MYMGADITTILVDNITNLEANNRSPKFQHSIAAKLIEHCKSHHFCINDTHETAKTWKAEFARDEDLGETHFNYVRDNVAATQLVFTLPSPHTCEPWV